MPDNQILEAALGYAHAGLSIIPVKKDKTPAAGAWTPYKTQIADDATIREWFRNGSNVAIIGGPVSGGLCVLDFDEARFFNAWIEAVGELGKGLVVQRTGREGGGYHVFFRCPNPGRSDTLAWIKDDSKPHGRKGAIDKKAGNGAEGTGYVVSDPSVHESGRKYTVIQGSLTAIPTLSQTCAEALIAAASKLDECPLTKMEIERENRASEGPSYPPGGGVIGAYNSAHTIEETLRRYGYVVEGKRAHPAGLRDSITVKEGRSFHHDTADPLSDGYWKKPFSVFCILEHHGNLGRAVFAAARELDIPNPEDEKFYRGEVADQAPAEIEDKETIEDSWGAPLTMRDAYQSVAPLVYVVDKLIVEESLTILYGDSGAMKSLLLADLAICCAGGYEFLGQFKTLHCPVMWLDWDNGRRRTSNRFGAFGRARGLTEIAPLYYYSMPHPTLDGGNSRDIAALHVRIIEHHIKLVIIDNLGLVAGPADENSREMAKVIKGFRWLAEKTGAAFIIIHHQSKDSTGFLKKAGDKLRGHSSIKAGVDVALYVSRDMDNEIPSSEINIFAPKQRDFDVPPFGARFEYTSKQVGLLETAQFVGTEYQSETERKKTNIDQLILDALDEPLSINQIRTRIGKGADTVRARLTYLAANKKIEARDGVYGQVYVKL